MLVTLNEILAIAEERKCAIGAFNTPNLECVTAVLNAAEKLNVPVMITHAELHESVAPLAVIGPVMVQAAKNAKVPVCVHLDHCETLSYMEQALQMGFTGVMYDGSTLPYEENVANTKIAVAMAKVPMWKQRSVSLLPVRAVWMPMQAALSTPIPIWQ